MRWLWKVLGLMVVVLAAYLLFWPIPIEPVAWTPPESAGYTGPHAQNQRLAGLTAISIAPELGPEHIVFGPDGKLYTGVLSGAVLRMNPDGSGIETVVNTGGRPLGLDFDTDGRLVIADALQGLLSVGADGKVIVLADRVGTDPIRYADAVVVAANGRMLFTDASRRISPQQFGTFDAALLDIMEHTCTGRVLEYDPVSRQTRVVIRDLCFPNGVALSGDQRHVFIAETGEYRIWKVDITAADVDARVAATDPTQRQARVIVSNLPGFPDNLTRSADGRIWTGLTKPRSPAVDALAGHPFLRAVTMRLPKSMWPVPPAYGHVVAFDEGGHIVADLQDPAGRVPETSGVTEHGGRLYIHSLHANAFGVIDAAAAGL
jgi:sugar lactone lactonase YvrE